MPLKTKINAINKSSLEVGTSVSVNEYLYFNNGSTNKPGFRINSATAKLQYSNDGVTWNDFTITTTGGDLTGPHTNAKVVGINGIPLDTSQVPTSGQFYYYNSSQNKWLIGSAGGDITGSIINTNVQGFNGIALDLTTPEDGYAYLYSSSAGKFVPSLVAFEPEPVIPTTGGDCSGLLNNLKVVGLNGYAINTSQTPTNGQVLFYDGDTSQWSCSQISGDVTGAFNNVRVVGLKGRELSTATPVDGNTLVYSSAQSKWNYQTLSGTSTSAIDLFNVGGRLTLESDTPYMTDPAGYINKTTLYWTPVKGGRIALYNGSTWAMYTPGELSITTTGLTGADFPAWYDPEVYGHPDLQDPTTYYIGGKVYDVFMSYNSGSPALVFGPAWTNDNTRSEELTTQDYVLVQPTTKHRYLGTVRVFGYENEGVILEYTQNKQSVWNYYNRSKIIVSSDDTLSVIGGWSLTDTGAWSRFSNYSRIFDAYHPDRDEFGYFDPVNCICALIGVSEDSCEVTCHALSIQGGGYGDRNNVVSTNISINDTSTFIPKAYLAGGNMDQIFSYYDNYLEEGFSIIRAINRKFDIEVGPVDGYFVCYTTSNFYDGFDVSSLSRYLYSSNELFNHSGININLYG